MIALLSVWIGLAVLALSISMIFSARMFTDVTLFLVLWLGSPAAICLAGLVLWSYRKEGRDDPGIESQRVQCKAAIVMAVLAAGIVYWLMFSTTEVGA
jgi:hypothetical protein